MKIEIWSDFACPFCYIGKHHLEQALAQFDGEVDVIFRAFELDVHAGGEAEESTQQRLMRKYHKTQEEALEMINRVETLAQQSGIEMRYGTSQYTRTFEAHRLQKFAENKGLGKEMAERIFKFYFCENGVLAKRTALMDLALDVGFERFEIAELLTGDDFGHEVREDERMANKLGITGVPFFLINGKIAISGAQPAEVLIEAIKKAKE